VIGSTRLDAVVKVGGGLLREPGALAATAAALARAAERHRVLVVTGGGPFADAVRALDREHSLGDDAAHWMAVLAMEQYAWAVATTVSRARLVASREEIAAALDDRAVPVLAPYRWLREADPLPHSWDVTSDSIAAWFAGALGARRLVLVKPAGADPAAPDVVDPYFSRALDGLAHSILPAHRVAELAGRLDRP
jgi:5-(aminomethyl)-3-furanmethanol phosphate kinase